VDVQSGTLALRAASTNTGTLRASTGTLLFDQPVTLAGALGLGWRPRELPGRGINHCACW
jgi:hypothetical protein